MNIDATIHLSDIVRAAVHQRIVSLDEEVDNLTAQHREIERVQNAAYEAVAEELTMRPPPSIKAIVDLADAYDNSGLDVEWDDVTAVDEAPTFVVVTIEPLRRDSYTKVPGVMGRVQVRVRLGPVSPEIEARFIAHTKATLDLRRLESRLADIRRMQQDPKLRERLEGELISRVVADKAPEVGALLTTLATDRVTRALTG